jgi:hypothetical protein
MRDACDQVMRDQVSINKRFKNGTILGEFENEYNFLKGQPRLARPWNGVQYSSKKAEACKQMIKLPR